MIKFFSTISFLLLASSFGNVFAKTPPSSINSKIVFEISDKYSEVRLGLTETSIYMIFSEGIRTLANNEIINQSNIDAHYFEDSEGNFINGETPLLTSNRIEFFYDDIKSISFVNGKINFEYKKNNNLKFEDIYSYKGTKVINNFYIEDLELFINTYRKMT